MDAKVESKFESMAAKFDKMDAEFSKVRAEIRAGNEETRRLGLVYEELIGRIRVMGEGIEELRRRV